MASEFARADVTAAAPDGAAASVDPASDPSGKRQPAARRRAGVPVWRAGKPDAVLAAAIDVAREAITTIARPDEIGAHVAARTEGDRLVTHLFESRLPGYVGWHWFAVVTRNSRSKVVTVSELGLLPSEDSVLAPEWVPWAERVRPEDTVHEDSADEDSPDEDPEDEDPADEEEAGEGDSDSDAGARDDHEAEGLEAADTAADGDVEPDDEIDGASEAVEGH